MKSAVHLMRFAKLRASFKKGSIFQISVNIVKVLLEKMDSYLWCSLARAEVVGWDRLQEVYGTQIADVSPDFFSPQA